MSVAPVTFIDFNSVNSANFIWPNGSLSVLSQNNEGLLGQAFVLTNSIGDVLGSASQFFTNSGGSPSIPYQNAWYTSWNSVTNKYSIQTASNATILSDLPTINSRSQLFLGLESSITYFNSPNAFAQTLISILNGPYASKSSNEIYRCPCENALNDQDLCAMGAWTSMAREIQLSLPDKSTTWLGPCLNPGKTMVIEGGIGNFMKCTVQVKRIHNLDRVEFKACNVYYKPCSSSLLIQLTAETCPAATRDVNYGAPPGLLTKMSMDLSVQAQVLGKNVFGTDRFCDNLPVVDQYESCGNNSVYCLDVSLPSALVNLQLEVPVKYKKDQINIPFVGPYNDAYCTNEINGGAASKAYVAKFEDATMKLDFALLDKPEINFPQPSIISDQFKFIIETTIMQAANTSLRQIIDQQLTDQMAPFLKDALQIAGLLDIVDMCIKDSDIVPLPNMTCNAGTTPTPPEQCNPCDECCLCLTSGDCGEKCLQNCPCVTPFCTSVDRIFDPLWWLLFFIIVIIFVVILIVGTGYIRGIGK